MGFYTKGEYLYLPNKKIVHDLLERDGAPTKESFTPYNGMNYLIGEQMKGESYSILGLDVIKERIGELFVTRMKGKDTLVNDSGDLNIVNNEEYEYFLEDIDEEYIKRSLIIKLIGIKKNKDGGIDIIKEVKSVQKQMYDKETGEVFNLSDVYVADEYEESYAIMSELKNKIPYLLKKLQDGSIQYGVSLLSMFIARDAVIQKFNRRTGEVKPRELLAYDIYRVSGTGDLLDTFDSKTANNTPKFIKPKDLVIGLNPNDPYYKAGIELTTISRQLGYNLYEEDVKDYSPSYINRLMCSYIISNQEVLSDMASYDPSIMKLFKDGGIFKTPFMSDNEFEPVNNILKLREMAARKSASVPEIHERIRKDTSYKTIKEPVKLINQFFKVYKDINKKSTIEEGSTHDCNLINETLCDSSGQPLIFKGERFLLGFGDTPLFNTSFFIITNGGYVIKIDDNNTLITSTTVEDLLTYSETSNRNLFDKKVMVL